MGNSRDSSRQLRQRRVRKRLRGSAEQPRLCITRSLRNISVQVIDDESGNTLASATSLEKGVGDGGSLAGAEKVGKLIAERAKEKGVASVVFDRAGNKYAGRVAKLAAAAREAGLKF